MVLETRMNLVPPILLEDVAQAHIKHRNPTQSQVFISNLPLINW
jgi:hypothetical protein